MGLWDKDFLRLYELSIEYLELYALCMAIMTWENMPRLNNTRVVIFCDNQAVVAMVNNTTSSCQNCMVLLRMLVLNNLQHNRRVFVKYIRSSDNILVDSLSRNRMDIFWENAPTYTRVWPDKIPDKLKNIRKIWRQDNNCSPSVNYCRKRKVQMQEEH